MSLRNFKARLEMTPLVGGGSLLGVSCVNTLARLACSAGRLSVLARPEAILRQGDAGRRLSAGDVWGRLK